MYEIIRKEKLAPTIKRLEIYAPLIARHTEAGNFIILRVNEEGERIPLTVAGYNRKKGIISIIFQEVGYTTKLLGQLNKGDKIKDIVGPLGRHIEREGYQKVILIGGGSGTAMLYPEVKCFSESCSELITITGARTKELIILENELKNYSDDLYITTDDGSYGKKGYVTDVLEELLRKNKDIDLVIAIGPVQMMKAVSEITKEFNIKTIVSLNSIMIDGIGMCGACRVNVGGETKFTCVDGPSFDGHQVDFDELMNRLQFYQKEEGLLKDLSSNKKIDGVD
jgi:ferredoxin--NADP+ reductase